MSKLLNVGLTPLKAFKGYQIIHRPIIKTEQKEISAEDIEAVKAATLLILTSKQAAQYFLPSFQKHLKNLKRILSIGKATTVVIESHGFNVDLEAAISTQEGIVEVLKQNSLESQKILIPRSSMARKVMDAYLKEVKACFYPFALYDTLYNEEFGEVDLREYEAVYFSSPSSVKYFFDHYPSCPKHLRFYTIGEITNQALLLLINKKQDGCLIIN